MHIVVGDKIEPKTEYVVKEVEDAYTTAADSWTEADWTHEHREISDAPEHGRGDVTIDSDGNIVYCEGGDPTCQYCLNAEAAASGAEATAEQAMDAWHARDFELAIKRMKEAVGYENEYGAAPTWDPVLKAMENALENDD